MYLLITILATAIIIIDAAPDHDIYNNGTGKTGSPDYCSEEGVGYHGSDFEHIKEITTPEDCQKRCQRTSECVVWTHDNAGYYYGCWLHNKKVQRQCGDNLTSGRKFCSDTDYCPEEGVGYLGYDFEHIKESTTPQDCQKRCQKRKECVVWTHDNNGYYYGCWLHSKKHQRQCGDRLTSGPKFCSGPCDNPDGYQVSDMDYDIDAATIIPDNDRELAVVNVINCDTETASASHTLRKNVAATHSWSFTEGMKIGTTASFTVGIAFIVDMTASVEVSTEVSFESTTGGSHTTDQEFSKVANTIVKPRHKQRVTLTAYRGKMSVPYTTYVICVKDGEEEVGGRVEGIFDGVNYFDSQIKFYEQKPVFPEECDGQTGWRVVEES